MMNGDSTINPNSVPDGSTLAIFNVTTNPLNLPPSFSIISLEQQEKINNCITFWKKQEANVNTQEALLKQLKFFYSVRRTILFIFPIVTLVIFSIMLYTMYDEKITDHWIFSGLTFSVGVAAILEIIFLPAREKYVESKIESVALDIENQGKKITNLSNQINALETLCSEQKKKLDAMNTIISQLQNRIRNPVKQGTKARK